ncbi:hypothetical protein KP509_02G048400 [Ceratopteris richardii]|uniref:SET domain-containing protein n=1 Tax=Ceratopteris richardii TaxID=49495 RepID=A0A8T2V950_CERRI|nr:hypothetical protein KP509_02G048400 [Ceratopteris richardii]
MWNNLRPLLRSMSTQQATQSKPGPPVRVSFTPYAGRGVFATRRIAEGEIIHTAEPLITHPSLQNISKVCYFCLRHLRKDLLRRDAAVEMDDNGMGINFCSERCSVSAEAFCAVEKKASWKSFHQFCSDEGLRLPLLAKRLMSMVLTGTASRDALEVLSFARHSEEIVSHWMHTRAMLLDTFKSAGVSEEQLAFVTREWYCGVLARLSLNSFRVEILTQDTSSLLMAAAASISGDAISGSAVYILPSMYNHDCDPNTDITWPTNATAHLSARRDIEADEELRITYIDASMPHRARQKLLKEAYHFACNCSRCKDGD